MINNVAGPNFTCDLLNNVLGSKLNRKSKYKDRWRLRSVVNATAHNSRRQLLLLFSVWGRGWRAPRRMVALLLLRLPPHIRRRGPRASLSTQLDSASTCRSSSSSSCWCSCSCTSRPMSCCFSGRLWWSRRYSGGFYIPPQLTLEVVLVEHLLVLEVVFERVRELDVFLLSPW